MLLSAHSSAQGRESRSRCASAKTERPTLVHSKQWRDLRASSSLVVEPGSAIVNHGTGILQAKLYVLSTERIPDITPLLKPTTLGDIATYSFLSIAGLFFGGETGLLIGSAAASRTITKDPASKARIENAFRKFKADALRRQADELDGAREYYSAEAAAA
jgi:hypothetical protein